MKDNSEEIFPIVDDSGNVIGKATRGECHNGSRLLHPVVHLHVFNSRGEVYLQRRPEFWTMDEIRDAIGKELLTPNFESEFQRFFLK